MTRGTFPRLATGAALAIVLVLSNARTMLHSVVHAAAEAAHVRATLRVGLWTLWRDREVEVTPSQIFHATMRTCAQCAAHPLNVPATIRAQGDQVAVQSRTANIFSDGIWLDGALLLAAHGEHIVLHHPVAVMARNGVLVLAVTLPVESYVERVVASESGTADSQESLQALAVVVRTFALHEAHGHADYDVCDSTHCQLLHWGGNSAREPAAHAATLATAGETLWFHDQRAQAYFNKDCGGHTAAAEEIWPHARPLAYLRALPDRYCTADGGGAWASQATRAELTAALATHGLAQPGWKSLTVERRGASGRAATLRVDQTEISAEDFRIAAGESLGWNRIPSTWFEVSQQGDHFEFHGRGWGHGVGLCQKGAAAMAARGSSMREILAQYFPGAAAADEETGRAWRSYAGSGFVLQTLDAVDAALLAQLEQARADAAQRSGLNAAAPFTVRAFPSTDAFRNATLAPGWVAAFTEGNWIGMQPLHTLAARKMLAATLRHEFLHALVEQQAGTAAPLWLREGLVELWSNANTQTTGFAPGIDAVEAGLARASSEAESRAAHRGAAVYAARLLERYGRAQVLAWLRSGVPGNVVAALGQR